MGETVELTTEKLTDIASAYGSGVRPDERMALSDWADRYRILSTVDSAEAGPWRTARTPYLKEIMDCLSVGDTTRTVAVMMGAQVGKTSCGLNWLGYAIDKSPAPMLAVQPTVELAKLFSTQRLAPMLENTARLRAKIPSAKSREGGNTQLSKEFPNGILRMAGANSAVGLRAMPVRFLYCDEVDGWPADVDGEGDPLKLAFARTRTFSRRKILLTSTPTLESTSRINEWFLRGDQRRYFVPCLHCGVFDHIRWSNIIWDKGKPETAAYKCATCEKTMPESAKTELLAAGYWQATAEASEPYLKSYHLSSLYSPLGWYTWREAATDFEAVKQNPDKLKGFVNVVLGEPWKEKGDAPDHERIYERRESYKIGTLPDGVKIITAGVDIQKDRIEAQIVGWSEGLESWAIDNIVIMGATDTLDSPAWRGLSDLLMRPISYENHEGALMLSGMGVDTGYNTQVVYSWIRQQPQTLVHALKGSDTASNIVGQPRKQDINHDGKRIARGVQLWPVGVSVAKSEFYGWLQLPMIPNEETGKLPSGFCHYPEFDMEFFKQLTAEQVVIKKVRGFKRRLWEKIRDRNEALDTRIYARAVATILQLDRYSPENWAELQPFNGLITAAPKRRKKTNPKFNKKSW